MMKLGRIAYAITFILMAATSIYSYLGFHSYYPSFADMIASPDTYKEFTFEAEGIILEKSEGSFIVQIPDENTKTLEVSASPELLSSISAGKVTAMKITYSDGKYSLLESHTYYGYFFLHLFSFIALVIFVILFFREWKFTSRGFKDA